MWRPAIEIAGCARGRPSTWPLESHNILDVPEGESSVEDLGLRNNSEEVSKVDAQVKSSDFQRVIEDVETLPVDDQMLLIEIIRQRLIQHRRSELVAEVAEARQAYRAGDVRRGTVEDLLKELDT
jgi:hypothetical protein